MEYRVERWLLQAAHLPRVWRHCPDCGVVRAFICSERFRMNAQKKTLDVWLIYRCDACEESWKLPIVSRCPGSRIDPSLREAFEGNDSAIAQNYACDVVRLKAHSVRIELDAQGRLSKTLLPTPVDAAGDCIHIAMPWPCDVRLDRLLARELGISRAVLQRLARDHMLHITPARTSSLSRPVIDGQAVVCHDGFSMHVNARTIRALDQECR